jgi:hypothetical protein
MNELMKQYKAKPKYGLGYSSLEKPQNRREQYIQGNTVMVTYDDGSFIKIEKIGSLLPKSDPVPLYESLFPKNQKIPKNNAGIFNPLELRVPESNPELSASLQAACTIIGSPIQESEISDSLKEEFEALVYRWKKDTQFSSTMIDIAMHPAYQQIIGMGPCAIVLILKKLSSELDHWFWALNAITREDPVPEESHGNIKAMAQAWLDWGKSKGYEY